MIDHEKCNVLLSQICEYVEGTLSDALCADLERHINECDNCTIVVNTLRKTIELYQGTDLVSETMPEDVRARLFLCLNLEDYLKK